MIIGRVTPIQQTYMDYSLCARCSSGTEDTQVNRISFLQLMSLELMKANQQGIFLIQNDCYCTRGRSKILCQRSSTWLYSQL